MFRISDNPIESKKKWHKPCHYFVIDSLSGAIATVSASFYDHFEVMHMELITRIKTGFFEMKPYRLKAEEGILSLIPIKASSEGSIILAEKNILSITLTEGRLPELEVQTRDTLYSGVLQEGSSLSEVVNYLKENLNINIICEYKGGENHA